MTAPATLYRIDLQLAREPGHPEIDNAEHYTIVAPLDADGRLDGAAWRSVKDHCRVVKDSADEPMRLGQLVHGPGGRWFIDYDSEGRVDTETGFRFQNERFVVGEYVSIEKDDKTHPFLITRSEKV